MMTTSVVLAWMYQESFQATIRRKSKITAAVNYSSRFIELALRLSTWGVQGYESRISMLCKIIVRVFQSIDVRSII
jgi:hypothetical protein